MEFLARAIVNRLEDRGLVEFRDAANALVDVGTLQAATSMAMPGMVMTGDVTVTPLGPGRFAIAGQYSMSGAWTLALDWSGPRGRGRTSVDVEVE